MSAVLVAVIACLLCAIGVAGIIVPVLPGSLAVIVALLFWAVFGTAPWPWLWFALGAAFAIAGMAASAVLTGRNLAKRGIPQWPVAVSLVVGVIAGFVIPGFGLILGFVVSLLLIELARVKDLRGAVSTSWVAVKSVGLGMLVELGCALAATTVLTVSVFVAFLS